jgi:hypothetical protein
MCSTIIITTTIITIIIIIAIIAIIATTTTIVIGIGIIIVGLDSSVPSFVDLRRTGMIINPRHGVSCDRQQLKRRIFDGINSEGCAAAAGGGCVISCAFVVYSGGRNVRTGIGSE